MSDGSIKIETKLDSSGVKKDLKEIEKTAETAGKSMSKSMDNAEKSMKKASGAFDGSKMAKQIETVAKKLDETSKKIDQQTQKLDKLKQAYDKSGNTKQKDNISKQMEKTVASIDKLERKIDELNSKKIQLNSDNGSKVGGSASKELDEISKKADETGKKVKKSLEVSNTNSLSKIGEDVQKTGEKISGVGDSLSKKVTAPILAFGALAANSAAKFEHEMADVSKEVEAKGENVSEVMGQMSKDSLKWSEDFGQSTNDINKGLLVLVKDGYSGAESMDIMNTALYTARGANEDLFTVIDQLGGSLEAYGQKTDNAAQTTANMSHMADTFAYISNHTKASISSLGEAFATAGQTASALGQPMEQTAAAIGILQSSNIDASTAATSLKAGLVNLTKPTKNMKKAMQELGLQAFDSNGKMKDYATIINDVNKGSKNMTDQQKQAAIAMIFGKESLASWNVLIGKGGDYLKDLATNAGNATGEVEHLSNSMKDTPVNKMKEAEASFKALGITFGEEVLPTLTPMVQRVTELLKSFADLDEGTKREIVNFALMAAAVGPVLKIVGTFTGEIGKLATFGANLGTKLGLITTGAEAGEAALGGLTLAGGIAAGAAAALTIGIAGYLTHNELMHKSVTTSTDDLNTWEKVVNTCTGSTIKSKSELQKAGLIYKDFGEGVSDSFKSGIKKATDEYHNFEMLLIKSDVGKKITDENSKSVTAAINSMIDGAKDAINQRKSEVSGELSKMFNQKDGINADEQQVLDDTNSAFDGKFAKVKEIQDKISGVWKKAIEEHGRLTEDDIKVIKDYLQQVQQIKAEAEAKNTAESTFAKNQYGERLKGISGDDAAKEYKSSSEELTKNFADARATYKTGMDKLAEQAKEYDDEALKEEDEAKKNQLTQKAANARKVMEASQKEYDELITTERAKRREYLDMLYEKDPSLKNNMNEVTGEMFTTDDKNSQGRLQKLKDKYTQIAEANKSGIKHVYDSTTGWHDIYVEVDEATGNVTSAFDINARAGETAIGGYSDKFEKAAKTAAEKAKKNMQNLYNAFQLNQGEIDTGGIKLSGDTLVDSSNATISKFDTIIQKADQTKVAIANINGQQVKIEFNKDGVVTNVKDVKDAINGLEKSPAKINVDLDDQEAINRFTELENLKSKFEGQDLKQKVTIDGEEFTKVDGFIDKLEKLPKDEKVDLKINGEEVHTVDEAIEKLKKVPKETQTDIQVNTNSANAKTDEAIKKLEELKKVDPNAKIIINGEEIPTIDEAEEKLKKLPPDTNTEIKVDSDVAHEKIDNITRDINNVPSEHDINFKVNVTGGSALSALQGTGEIGAEGLKELGITKNYTGTNSYEGLTTKDEHGWEMTTGENELYYLGGGTGILDHGSSMNAMKNDVNTAVTNKTGQIVNKLVTALGGQASILNQISSNTGKTATASEKNNTLNKDLAEKMVQGWGTSNNFSALQNEIKSANDAKEKADKSKVEDNSNYMRTKQIVDDLNGQIEDLKNKAQDITDNMPQTEHYTETKTSKKGKTSTVNKTDDSAKKASEAEKKEIEIEQHALERKKDLAEKEMNLAKEVAENEISEAKRVAEEQVKEAENKKEKLTKFAEATTTAIKNQLELEKKNSEKILNDELAAMEKEYNKKTESIEATLKKKTDKIDKQIKALEQESTDNSRDEERTASKNNINVLKTKQANTASEADKRSIQLEIDEAQKELNKKEDDWDIEDQKEALEKEKENLSTKAENEKKSLEKSYNTRKEAKEKELKKTDEFYDKLLEEDNINARARYMLLDGNQQDLINLINSYNPQWQSAGQSLADSLLNGLTFNQQSIEQAVGEILSFKGVKQTATTSNVAYYDEKGNLLKGYESGTTNNPKEDFYLTNENGPEMSTRGDVAYVSKGAAIKNAMQTEQFVKSEIARQVSLMKSSVLEQQSQMRNLLLNNMAKSTSNTKIDSSDRSVNLYIDKFNNNSKEDIRQIANELGGISIRERV